MAEDSVILKVQLEETPAMAAVRRQIEAAGLDPSTMRAPGGRRPPQAGTVTPATEEQRVQKDRSDRKNVERDLNLRQQIQEGNTIDRELNFNLRQEATRRIRDQRRGERVTTQQAGAAARVGRPGLGGGAAGARGRRRGGVLRAGVASASAARVAALGGTLGLGAGARAGLASGAATAAATNPPAAAGILIAFAIASGAAAPAMLALTGAVIAATRAFTEMEQLGQVDPRVALAQAMRDMRQTLGLIRRSDRIGGDASQFITARSQLDQAIRDAGTEILREILPLLTNVAQLATFLTQTVTPVIGPFFEQVEFLIQATLEVYKSFPIVGGIIEELEKDMKKLVIEAEKKAKLDEQLEDAQLSRLFDVLDPNDFKPRNIPGISGT